MPTPLAEQIRAAIDEFKAHCVRAGLNEDRWLKGLKIAVSAALVRRLFSAQDESLAETWRGMVAPPPALNIDTDKLSELWGASVTTDNSLPELTICIESNNMMTIVHLSLVGFDNPPPKRTQYA